MRCLLRLALWLTVAPPLLSLPLRAQMNVARNLDTRALADSAPTGAFSGATRAFTEWQRGYGSVGEEQTWDVKAGLTVDIVRWQRKGILFGPSCSAA